MLILNEIIEIKLQMINIFNIQIKYLQKLDFITVRDLQYIEKELAIVLDYRCKQIQCDITIISCCNNQDIVELLKSVCLKYEKALKMRNKLFIIYNFNNKKQKFSII
ncbi:hypothetical protein FDZ63_02075 [Ehrlichia ruminantium]|nr:hypothetical protein FDZ65_02080 [Ehrlichia ruminantium]QLK54127.1 hypothetical protein FDZ63_02075 [Ehrlichia ruminantium]QLK56879.1 hypothetical protein FDZ60_02080 [Ehrlichia ruminantium]